MWFCGAVQCGGAHPLKTAQVDSSRRLTAMPLLFLLTKRDPGHRRQRRFFAATVFTVKLTFGAGKLSRRRRLLTKTNQAGVSKLDDVPEVQVLEGLQRLSRTGTCRVSKLDSSQERFCQIVDLDVRVFD